MGVVSLCLEVLFLRYGVVFLSLGFFSYVKVCILTLGGCIFKFGVVFLRLGVLFLRLGVVFLRLEVLFLRLGDVF